MRPPRPGPLLLAGLAAAALTWMACGDEPVAPAPVPVEATTPEPEPEPEEPDAGPPFVEHTVEEGQTLWDISRAYSVSVDRILEFNRMRPRDVRRLSKGRVLRIPGASEAVEVTRPERPTLETLPPLEDGAYHFLAEGETLWDVARSYDRSVDEILERNELDDDGVRALRAGQPVVIPGIRQSDVRQAAPRDDRAPRGIRHTVAPGETVWDLARSFQVSVAELMAANAMSSDDVATLREGRRLFIPGVAEDRGTGRVRREQSPRQRQAVAQARRLGLGTKGVAQQLLRGRVETRWMRAIGSGWNRLPGTLRWPVTNGRFVRGFGSGEGGYHLAVDIVGEIGWNVRAAARGIVAYSGDEVPGYGNLVVLVHPGGWVTMYAHNSANFVVAGEVVPAGGVLAEVGSTGISRGPHVHFELMYDGKNCDPATLFRPGVRHRSRLAAIPAETWSDGDEPPPGVRCYLRRRHPNSRWVMNEDPTADAEGGD